MTKEIKIQKRLLIIALILACLLTCFSNTITNVYASSIDVVGGYTDVLEDLQKDENFSIDNYPIVKDDYSLQVIQIAESSDRELFVYVYQPCSPNSDLNATSINLSTTTGRDLSYKNYSLQLLSKNGCFGKYILRNFTVQTEDTRIYDISSIFRKWNEKYDADSGNDNIINEVSYAVAQKFTAKTMEDGTVEYANNGIDVVYITDKWCGFCRYKGGFSLLNQPDSCDSWFVCFDTDKPIDKLLEADVYYVDQTWTYGTLPYYVDGGFIGIPFDTLIPSEITSENIDDFTKIAKLDYTQKGSFQGDGWWASKYTWNRISTIKEFIANEDIENIYELGILNVKEQVKLTDDSLQKIKGKKWVLRFAETEYVREQSAISSRGLQHVISNVSILRLKFETDGVVYNLGAIDNKQSPDLIPDNDYRYSVELADPFKWILYLLIIILILVILAPILPTIFNFICAVIKYLFKAIMWMLKLPFRIYDYISSKHKDKGE